MDLIPCPRCRQLCHRLTERCEKCGCPVRLIAEKRRRQARAAVIAVVILFLLLLANSIYWATKL